MKKLLATLAVTPLAVTACGSKVVHTSGTVETFYSLGHGKYVDKNNSQGNLGHQNNKYNVVESKIRLNEGKLTYTIHESTNYIDITNSNTEIVLAETAKAIPNWTDKIVTRDTERTPKVLFENHADTLTYPHTITADGTTLTSNVTFANAGEFKAVLDAGYDDLSSFQPTDTITPDSNLAKLLNFSATWAADTGPNGHNQKFDEYLGTKYKLIDATSNPKKFADNVGESLRYIYDFVEVDASFKDKLVDGEGNAAVFVAKTNDNYGGTNFNFVTHTDKLIAHMAKDFDTCEKVNAVSDTTLKNMFRGKAGENDITGASFTEGGLYRGTLIKAARKVCNK